MRVETFTGGCGLEAARQALKQAAAEIRFKVCEMVRECRNGNPQLVGSAAQGAVFIYGNEIAKLSGVHSFLEFRTISFKHYNFRIAQATLDCIGPAYR